MATGDEVQGRCSDGVGSEDLDQLKCQPCLEDGNLQDAVGMCIDCQEYLCSKCFEYHTLPKPSRNHKLLDREQMFQEQIHVRLNSKDTCSEKCQVHEDEIIKYYCKTHRLLGCTVCITLEHKRCDDVQYIPHVAKDLASNGEYQEVQDQLKAALETFMMVSENSKRNADEFGISCEEALVIMKEYQRKLEAALDRIRTTLASKTESIKSTKLKEFETVRDKYKGVQFELQTKQSKIEALENAGQNCSSYIEMMRTKERLESMSGRITEAVQDKTYRRRQLRFNSNQDTLDSLNDMNALGTLSVSGEENIASAKHDEDINVKAGTDKNTCWITGLSILEDNRLVLADYSNGNIKALSARKYQLVATLKLSSVPWDIAAVDNDKVAVTLPNEKRVMIVAIGVDSMDIKDSISVNGICRGIDHRNGKLAVSFDSPREVHVLNLHGTLLYSISNNDLAKPLLNRPYYIAFSQDDTMLYVSNDEGDTVVCVKVDGTVVATYTDNDLRRPLQSIMDRNGNVYVCAKDSDTVHQITTDCKKIRTLLTESEGVSDPYSVCLNKEENKIFVGNSNVLKVYTVEYCTH